MTTAGTVAGVTEVAAAGVGSNDINRVTMECQKICGGCSRKPMNPRKGRGKDSGGGDGKDGLSEVGIWRQSHGAEAIEAEF